MSRSSSPPQAIWRSHVQDSPVHDCRHVSCQCVHVSTHVARSISSRRSSHLEYVDKNGAQCLNVSEVELGMSQRAGKRKTFSVSLFSTFSFAEQHYSHGFSSSRLRFRLPFAMVRSSTCTRGTITRHVCFSRTTTIIACFKWVEHVSKGDCGCETPSLRIWQR